MSVFDVLKYPIGPNRITFEQVNNLPGDVRKKFLIHRNKLFEEYTNQVSDGKLDWDLSEEFINQEEMDYAVKLLRDL